MLVDETIEHLATCFTKNEIRPTHLVKLHIFKAPVHDIFWKSSIFALILAFDVWIKRAKVKVHPFSTYAFSENHMQSTCGYLWDLVKFTRYICVDSRTINELLTACFHEKSKINQKISNLSYCWFFVIISFSQNNLIG